jgi:DNA-binding LytR/AlgR family response regulator
MLKVAIIEDEKPARKKLIGLLNRYDPGIKIVAELDSVESTIAFSQQETLPDLVFSDIQLMDGNVFESMRKVALRCPVIFTTAYNEFLTEAFKHSGIAYLLKPFSYEDLEEAMQKYCMLRSNFLSLQKGLMDSLQKKDEFRNYVQRLTVRKPDGIYILDIERVVYFSADGPVIKAFDEHGKTWLLQESSLQSLQDKLDPELFYRINRAEIIQKKFIHKISNHTKNSVAVFMNVNSESLIASQSRSVGLKEWWKGAS